MNLQNIPNGFDLFYTFFNHSGNLSFSGGENKENKNKDKREFWTFVNFPRGVLFARFLSSANEVIIRMMVDRVEGHLFMYRRPVYRVFQYLETSE